MSYNKDDEFIGIYIYNKAKYLDEDRDKRIFIPKYILIRLKWIMQNILSENDLDISELKNGLIKYEEQIFIQYLENEKKIQDLYINDIFIRQDVDKWDYDPILSEEK